MGDKVPCTPHVYHRMAPTHPRGAPQQDHREARRLAKDRWRKDTKRGDGMEFGILFTSHPNHASEPYPHREVHARVTAEIQAADALGYDIAWVAEHHFSNQYGIMPDVFTYM